MPVRDNEVVENDDTRIAPIIHEIALMAARIFNKRVKEIGFTRSQWEVLHLLHFSDGKTQTEIAAQLIMARPPLGKLIDRLEKDQWVQRRTDPNDRRVKRVFLTKKSMPMFEPLEKHVSDIGDMATAALDNNERQQFISMLLTTHKNLSLELVND